MKRPVPFLPDRLAIAAACLMTITPTPALQAQSQVDVLFHAAGLDYADTGSRDGGYAAGLYATWGADWKHLVEGSGTFTRIRYVDGYHLEQVDITAAYSRFWARGSARIGGHWLESTDPLTDGGIVLFGGASAYRPGVWSAGTEAALSHYSGYGSGLTITQLAPALGLSSGNAARGGMLGAVVRGYWIHHSADSGLDSRDFLSGEATVYLTFSNITLSGTGWVGEQSLAVRSGGMLVYNLAELHTGGYGGGLRWVATPRAALSAGLYTERIRETEPGRNENVRLLAVALGFTL
jgi:hypothetical protein